MAERRTRYDDAGNAHRRKKKNRAVLIRIKKKNSVAFGIIGIVLLVLAGRIFLINYKDGDKYSKEVLDHQKYTSTILPYKRGQIIDAKGTILAYSERVYHLILDPKIILSDDKYKNPTLEALVSCFDLKREELENILASKPSSQYEKLLKNLTSDQIQAFKALQEDTKNNPYIKGVWFEDSYIRQYPYSTLACDVIGFASSENGGELGLENYYNDSLSGTDGITYGYINSDLNIEQTTKEAIDGYNLITTLDFSVQSIIENHIKQFNEEYGSKNTAVVVMDPNTGGVMGMASYPVFDLNSPRDLTTAYTQEEIDEMSDETFTTNLYSLWKNFCVSETYEPGSTYKPFTVSAGLEEGFIGIDENFLCTGSVTIGPDVIHCHDKSGHGELTLKQTLMYSCNPAMMQIAAKLGAVTFAQYQERFGMGRRTGIDLPGEEAGIVKTAENMQEIDLAACSFGQTNTVNMMQMVSAFSSLINGGNYYKPHIVKRIEKANGEVVSTFDSKLVKQTVTKSTSDTINEYLKATVDEGLAKNARVQGYSIAGKTGTAQKYPREDNNYLISFMGYAPADNPKFVIYVVIDEPDKEKCPNASSAPVLTLSNQILTDLLPYMNVYKDSQAEAIDNTQNPVEEYQQAPFGN